MPQNAFHHCAGRALGRQSSTCAHCCGRSCHVHFHPQVDGEMLAQVLLLQLLTRTLPFVPATCMTFSFSILSVRSNRCTGRRKCSCTLDVHTRRVLAASMPHHDIVHGDGKARSPQGTRACPRTHAATFRRASALCRISGCQVQLEPSHTDLLGT